MSYTPHHNELRRTPLWAMLHPMSYATPKMSYIRHITMNYATPPNELRHTPNDLHVRHTPMSYVTPQWIHHATNELCHNPDELRHTPRLKSPYLWKVILQAARSINKFFKHKDDFPWCSCTHQPSLGPRPSHWFMTSCRSIQA
jgi:hypothetical protein